MPDGDYTVRLLDDGPAAWRNADGYTATQDEPVITDLSSDAADYLTDNHPFEEVVDVDVSAQADADTDDASDESSQSNANANAAAAADAAADDGDFDVDAFHDQGYQERADQVESGAVDDHLDEIYAAETSDTVKEAIEARDAFNGGS